MDTIRVGLIGAGANTRLHHAPKLQAQEGVEVVGVVNRSRASSQRFADEFEIPRVYDNWLDVLEDDEIDAVCIGTWPYMHATLTMAALEAEKHVLVEARMAMDSGEARAMLAASQEAPHLVAQIVPAPHTLTVDRHIIDLVSEGYIGELVALDARVGAGAFPDWDAPLHWRHDRDLSGNNIMMMGIWYEAISRWIGPAATVSATGQTVVGRHADADGRRRATSIPDHLDITCRLQGGGQMHLQFSTVAGFGPTADVWLHGTEGTLHLISDPAAASTGNLALYGGGRGDAQLSAIEIPAEKIGGWRVEEEFINAIRGLETVTHTSFTDGVKYMEFTDAVTASMQTGQSIPLPL